MLRSKISALLTFAIVLLTASAFAQTGKIAGKITDQKTSETLIGATVTVEGTTTGVAADVDGKYILSNLKPGTYSVQIRFIGYQTKSISDVVVKADEVTNLDVTLADESQKSLNEVVIRSTYRQASVASLYAAQKNSVSISDGVTADVIKKSPDRNTADVLKRVSGATVQDNKFVVVRGLSDRYNAVMLDNATLPSTEPNRKAFSFDIVPSNLIENLTITKTATPDQTGEFAGGLINITTKDIPDQNFVSLSIGEGFNTASTFKNFKSGPRNTSDYFGFDNGQRSLPNGFVSYNSVANGLSNDVNSRMLRSITKDYNIYNNTALPTQSYQLSIGKAKDYKNGSRLGAILALTYRNSQTIQNETLRDYYDYHYKDNVYKFSTNVGALLNVGYTYGKSKITFKNLYNRIYDDSFLARSGNNTSSGVDVRYFAFDLLQKALLKSTLDGSHQIGDNGSKLNWTLSYNNVINDQPGQRKLSYSKNLGQNVPYEANVSTLGKENATLYGKLNENSYSAAVNYSMPVKKLSGTFKVGASSYYRDRDYDVRFIGAVIGRSTNDPDVLGPIRQRPLNTLYGRDVIDANIYDLKELPGAGDSYTANSLTNAGYLMMDNKIGKLRFTYGARIEQFKLDLDPKDPNLAKVRQNYTDILPSANITYSLTDKINLRTSYSRTLARPEFRELSVTQYYDYEILAFQQGDPMLKKAKIDNIDLRFELYPSAGQILSVSGFYKKFTNAIETYNADLGSTRTITYFNSDKANVYGVEFEVRKSLDFIVANDFWKNTIAYANVAFIKSTARNSVQGLKFKEQERPLVGQAPYVFNGGLQHTFLNNKYSFNALYNRVGRRLSVAAGVLYEGVWEAPRDVVDLQVGMKLLKNKGELKFTAGDLLNQRITFYYDNNFSKKYDAGDYTQSSYKPGSTFSLAFNYTF